MTTVVVGAAGPVSSAAALAAHGLIDPPTQLGKSPNSVYASSVNATPVRMAVAGTVTIEVGKLDVARAAAFDACRARSTSAGSCDERG